MFPYAKNALEVSKIREFKVNDMAKRLGVLAPDRVHIRNYLIDKPKTAYNPAFTVKGDIAYVFPRAILGYFMYVSGILKIEIPIEDILSGESLSFSEYSAELVIYPTIKHDIWGTEDPRIVEIDGKYYMVYVGRGINYFNPSIRYERTLPVIAEAKNRKLSQWEKIGVFVLDKKFRRILVSDKDAFVVKTSDGRMFLFHRPHMMDERYYLAVSTIPESSVIEGNYTPPEDPLDPPEIEVNNTRVVLEPQSFEIKLGWAAPPIEVEKDTYLALVHGIDSEIQGYRVFAALFKYEKDTGIRPIGVTKEYIMAPQALYEVFGDRPYVVFPCGNVSIDGKLIIAYGAADYAIAFAEISIDELMSEIDKNIIE